MVGDAYYLDDQVMVCPTKNTGEMSLTTRVMAEQALCLDFVIQSSKSHTVAAGGARFLGQGLRPPSSRAETPKTKAGASPPHQI